MRDASLGVAHPSWALLSLSVSKALHPAGPALPQEPVLLSALCIGKQRAVLQKEHNGGRPGRDSACLDTGCTRRTCSRMLSPVI